MLVLFDSTVAFRAQYPYRHDLAALLGQLVLDRDNPRSLAAVAHALREPMAPLRASVPDPAQWQLAPLCEPGFDANYPALHQLLHDCSAGSYQLSQAIDATYFTHAGDGDHSLGA